MNSPYKIILAGALVVFASACTATVQAPTQTTPVTPPVTTTPTQPTTPPSPTTPVQSGNSFLLQNEEWGAGNGSVILDIGADSSTVTVGCANGEINRPFTLTKGSDGYDFSLPGTYVPGGPPRAIIDPTTGEPRSPDYSATYSGSMASSSATTMHFSITPNGGTAQEYDLTQGHFTVPRVACPL